MSEKSPLESAFDNYREMEREVAASRAKMQDLLVTNANLLSEVHMLREALERADTDRIRLQAVSSTLMGQLMAINAVIAEAVKLSVKHGVEAAEETKAAEPAAEAAAEPVQRAVRLNGIEGPSGAKASQRPAIPGVNWSAAAGA